MSDNFLRNAKYGPFYVSDPKGRFLGLHIYQGVFTLIPIIQAQKGKRKKTVSGGSVGGSDTVGDIDEPYPIRLLELKAKSMAFLDTSPDAILAMLYEDGQDDVHLKCYKVKITGKDKDLEELELKGKLVLDPGAKIVIPVLGELGGMIILGEQKVQYVDISGREYATKSYILREPTDFATWAKKSETEYLLGDEYGKLYALNLVIGGRGTMDELKVREIGQV